MQEIGCKNGGCHVVIIVHKCNLNEEHYDCICTVHIVRSLNC